MLFLPALGIEFIWEAIALTIMMEKDLGLLSVADGYEKFMRVKRMKNLVPDTIRFYEQNYRFFAEFFDVTQPCASITKDTFLEYAEHIQALHDVQTSTINTYLRAVRAFFYFFMEEGYTQPFKVKMLKEQQKIKETYTEQELAKLFKKPNMRTCDFGEYRCWVMVNYLLGTGNRIRTAVNVKIGHLDFENGLIFLAETKNKRQQIIPMAQSLSQILQEYLTIRKGEPDDYLFCSIHGTPLTRDGASTTIYKFNHRRGVERTSVHLFRHTFAKMWILRGGDPFELQSILGHSDQSMVKRYVNIYGKDLKPNFAKYNPLDNFLREQGGETIRMRK